jgi:hypothetical protein
MRAEAGIDLSNPGLTDRRDWCELVSEVSITAGALRRFRNRSECV